MASPNQLSFLPDDYMERKSQRRTNAICAVLSILVIGGCVVACVFCKNAKKALRGEHEGDG